MTRRHLQKITSPVTRVVSGSLLVIAGLVPGAGNL
jgi:hypothetical protein